MKTLVYIFLTLTLNVTIFANASMLEPKPPFNGKIMGEVREMSHKKAIEYANIALYRLQDSVLINGTISNSMGKFILEQVDVGNYYLVVDFIGYGKKVIPDISVSKKNRITDLGELFLEQANYQLNEVTISADKNMVDFKIDKKVVNVAQHANAAGGSVAEVLENVPSINVDIEGNTSLRGSSSFTVLIDGKPSPVSGSDILKQIPASAVENVEIITNPSAKYDPEGTTGIINIIMKKGYSEGLNGLVSAFYGTWDKFGANLNLNYRKKKSNLFLIGNYRKNPTNAISSNERESYYTDDTYFVNEYTRRKRTMLPFKVNPGIDLYLNDKNTLTISGTFGGWGMERLFDSEYEAYSANDDEKNYSKTENDFNIDGIYYVANASYQHLFTGKNHKLDISLSAWRWNNLQTELSLEQSTDENYNTLALFSNVRTNLDEERNNIHFKTDYSLPLKSSKIELGLDLRLTNQEADFEYENQNLQSGKWEMNSDFSNRSTFFRNLYAAYATYSGKLFNLEYQAGIRSEMTNRYIKQIETDEEYPLDLLKWYPSLHISRTINAKQQIQLSYSRRINRPQPWQLNPYPGYTDSYNYFQGNPLLKPEDTDAFELNYIHRFDQLSFSAGAYYRHSFNSQEMVQEIREDEPGIVYLTFGNLDKTTSVGMEYMFNYLPNQKMNINLSGNVYYFNVYSSFTGTEEYRESINWDARLNTSYNIGKTSKLQFTGVYNSPSARGQGTTKAFYYFDLGLRQQLLKRKLTASILVHNIFRTGRYDAIVDNENFKSSFSYKGESPVIRLSLSYMINQYERKQREAIDVGAGAN
jgi:outer membrane receptor protein involved in Fe transport